jgi:hypothetical protein
MPIRVPTDRDIWQSLTHTRKTCESSARIFEEHVVNKLMFVEILVNSCVPLILIPQESQTRTHKKRKESSMRITGANFKNENHYDHSRSGVFSVLNAVRDQPGVLAVITAKQTGLIFIIKKK